MSLRFPNDIGSSSKTRLTMKIHSFDGFDLSKVHDPSTFDIQTSPKETIVLPAPDQLQQTYSANYGSINSLAADLREFIGKHFDMVNRAEASFGSTLFSPTANIYQGNESQRHQLSWILTPNNQSEADSIERIARALTLASLPEVSNAVLALMPDLIEVKLNNHGYISYMLSFIESVNLDATPAGMFQQYQDGKLPVYSLSLQLIEVTQRTKQIEEYLRGES